MTGVSRRDASVYGLFAIGFVEAVAATVLRPTWSSELLSIWMGLVLIDVVRRPVSGAASTVGLTSSASTWVSGAGLVTVAVAAATATAAAVAFPGAVTVVLATMLAGAVVISLVPWLHQDDDSDPAE